MVQDKTFNQNHQSYQNYQGWGLIFACSFNPTATTCSLSHLLLFLNVLFRSLGMWKICLWLFTSYIIVCAMFSDDLSRLAARPTARVVYGSLISHWSNAFKDAGILSDLEVLRSNPSKLCPRSFPRSEYVFPDSVRTFKNGFHGLLHILGFHILFDSSIFCCLWAYHFTFPGRENSTSSTCVGLLIMAFTCLFYFSVSIPCILRMQL